MTLDEFSKNIILKQIKNGDLDYGIIDCRNQEIKFNKEIEEAIDARIKEIEVAEAKSQDYYYRQQQLMSKILAAENFDDATKIVDKYQKEHQMTREEAFQKIRRYFPVGQQNDFLKALEVLGLIKFEEEKLSIIQKAKNYVNIMSWPISGAVTHDNVAQLNIIINELLIYIEQKEKIIEAKDKYINQKELAFPAYRNFLMNRIHLLEVI